MTDRLQGRIPGINQPVSRVMLGTAGLHAFFFTSRRTLAQQFRLLDEVFDLGCNALDTAPIYFGAERLLGRWLRNGVQRDHVVIFTKCGHPSLRSSHRLRPDDIRADLQGSLKRLQTDYVDHLMFHRDSAQADLAMLVECMDELRQEGTILSYGVSNWTHTRLQQLLDVAKTLGLAEPVASSPHFSLLEWSGPPPWSGCSSIAGDSHHEARLWYESSQMPVVAWSPLAGGLLKHGDPSDLDLWKTRRYRAYDCDLNRARVRSIRAVALEMGISVSQLGIAYITNQPMNVFLPVSSRHPSHVRSDLQALEITLSPDILAALEHPLS